MFERLDSRMDVLTQVLDAVHLGNALSHRIELRAPWALHFGATNRRAGFHVVAAGKCCVSLDDTGDSLALDPGDVVVFPHGAGHTLGDSPDTSSVDVRDIAGDLSPGERLPAASQGVGERTVVFCGAYSFSADGANPLLRGLPEMLAVRADRNGDSALQTTVRLLIAEADTPGSGIALVIDRLVDLLFVYALRAWIGQQHGAGLHSWFGALQDAAVGPAISAIHAEPARDWTVATLADRSGLSRAAFARRFAQSVGEPPLSYVTRWRMTVAADLLVNGSSIAEVAHRVGYENEFAFAKAFKRVRGVAPGRFRRSPSGSRAADTSAGIPDIADRSAILPVSLR